MLLNNYINTSPSLVKPDIFARGFFQVLSSTGHFGSLTITGTAETPSSVTTIDCLEAISIISPEMTLVQPCPATKLG